MFFFFFAFHILTLETFTIRRRSPIHDSDKFDAPKLKTLQTKTHHKLSFRSFPESFFWDVIVDVVVAAFICMIPGADESTSIFFEGEFVILFRCLINFLRFGYNRHEQLAKSASISQCVVQLESIWSWLVTAVTHVVVCDNRICLTFQFYITHSLREWFILAIFILIPIAFSFVMQSTLTAATHQKVALLISPKWNELWMIYDFVQKKTWLHTFHYITYTH